MRQRFLFFGLIITMAGHTASAQLVSFGVKGGVRFTDAAGAQDESRPYIVGPSIEFRLPASFAIEFDALYQRTGNTSLFNLLDTSYIFRQRGNSWEFPLLGKYYFMSRTSAWRPFIGTGWAFRTTQIHSVTSVTTTDTTGVAHTTTSHDNYGGGLDAGAAFAAGVRFHLGRLAIVPEARYTRWGSSENFNRKNEAGFLLGITF
jgi:hypothetical protein